MSEKYSIIELVEIEDLRNKCPIPALILIPPYKGRWQLADGGCLHCQTIAEMYEQDYRI